MAASLTANAAHATTIQEAVTVEVGNPGGLPQGLGVSPTGVAISGTITNVSVTFDGALTQNLSGFVASGTPNDVGGMSGLGGLGVVVRKRRAA